MNILKEPLQEISAKYRIDNHLNLQQISISNSSDQKIAHYERKFDACGRPSCEPIEQIR